MMKLSGLKQAVSHWQNCTEDGLVALSREKLHVISSNVYSDDPAVREEQVKTDMFNSILDTGKNKRPSVETSLA